MNKSRANEKLRKFLTPERRFAMRIDVHAHYYPEKYIACVSRLRGESNYRLPLQQCHEEG
ncbi:MAG: hypothetical protein ACREQA_24165 [Candidatus Binatia bacterium]